MRPSGETAAVVLGVVDGALGGAFRDQFVFLHSCGVVWVAAIGQRHLGRRRVEALGVAEHLVGDGDDAFDLPPVTDLATDRGLVAAVGGEAALGIDF